MQKTPGTALVFAGKYKGHESCSVAGNDTTGFTITQSSDSTLVFSSLYKSGRSFSATAKDSSGAIPAQTFSGDSLLLGSFSLSHDTLSLNLLITAFSFRDNCSGIYIKQQ